MLRDVGVLLIGAIIGVVIGWGLGRRSAHAQYRIYDAEVRRQISIMWANMKDQASVIKALSEDTMSAEILPDDYDEKKEEPTDPSH